MPGSNKTPTLTRATPESPLHEPLRRGDSRVALYLKEGMGVRFWLAVLLIFIGFYVRAHHVTALPPFNDENHHIRRAEVAWSFSDPIVSFSLGKTLTYYWIGLFNPDRLDAIWMGRTVTGLFALLGLAGVYAIARRLFGGWAGVLALYLAVFTPYMVFFDRLAFSDPLASALGILVIWMTLRMIKHPVEWEWGLLTGILITLAVLAKLIALPFTLVPLWAIAIQPLSPDPFPLTQGKGNQVPPLFTGEGFRVGVNLLIHQYKATLIACYGFFSVSMIPFFLWIVYREISGQRISVVDPNLMNTASPLEQIINNLSFLWNTNWVLISPMLVILGGIATVIALYYEPRKILFLLGCAALPWSLTVISAGRISTRYLELGVLPILIVIAGAMLIAVQQIYIRMGLLSERGYPKLSSLTVYCLLTLWLFIYAQPFALSMWTDPRELKLPERDYHEYFANFTAGYGLIPATNVMLTLPPSTTSGKIPVIGLVGSCHQIRLYLDEFGPVSLECPFFGWQGEFMEDVAQHVDQRLSEESVLYLLVEPELEFTDLSKLHVRHEVIGRFERPFNGMTVELWQVFPR